MPATMPAIRALLNLTFVLGMMIYRMVNMIQMMTIEARCESRVKYQLPSKPSICWANLPTALATTHSTGTIITTAM